MPVPSNASDLLDREFLAVRARLIDLAATLDRLDRAAGSADDDPRMDQIRRSLEVLHSPGSGRAEKLQMLFSLPYEEIWRSKV
ncbi:MAG: hypothetical protein HQ581_24660 [Planctomycetes bacterium]|nr:hypothetical protein [Planctomycetota bacterium]